MPKKFKVKTAEEEYKIISTDDEFFAKSKEYMKPYLLDALETFEMDEKTKTEVFWALTNDIPIAAKRYLEDKNIDKGYKFSTYFGWYIGQRINKIRGLKRVK